MIRIIKESKNVKVFSNLSSNKIQEYYKREARDNNDIRKVTFDYIKSEIVYTPTGQELVNLIGENNNQKIEILAHPRLLKTKLKKGLTITTNVILGRNKLLLVSDI